MIRNVLFDFGQVLYAIDPVLSAAAFTRLFPDKASEWKDILHHPVFIQLEKGQISPEEFYQTLRELGGRFVSDDFIRDAWNALLLGPQPGRVELLASLATRYKLALLSNTNQIHLEHFFEESRPILNFFGQRFLSHEVRMRKPEPEIYRYVLDRTGWNAEQTLFIDDVPANLEPARSLGIQTLLYTDHSSLESVQIME